MSGYCAFCNVIEELPENKQLVPRVGRPAVMLTISKQTVMKKESYNEV